MILSDVTYEDVVVVTIAGELDHSNSDVLGDSLAAHLDGAPHHLVLDLSECPYMDSAALAVLLTFHQRHRAEGVLAVAAASPNVRRLLELVGLSQSQGFEIYEDLEEALFRLSSGDRQVLSSES